MSGRQFIPAPDDFAVTALGMMYNELERYYRRSPAVVLRWIKSQPPEWQAAHEARRQERERAHREQQGRNVGKLSAGVARPWQKGRAPKNAIKTPPDLFSVMLQMSYAAASARYGFNMKTLARMVSELPEAQRDAIKAAGIERKRAASIGNALKGAVNNKRAAVSRKRERPVKEPKAKAPKKTRWATMSRSSLGVSQQIGVAAMAADTLRRAGYVPVFDAGKVYGKTLAGFYVVGRLRLPVADMIDLARQKGFDADAWRALA